MPSRRSSVLRLFDPLSSTSNTILDDVTNTPPQSPQPTRAKPATDAPEPSQFTAIFSRTFSRGKFSAAQTRESPPLDVLIELGNESQLVDADDITDSKGIPPASPNLAITELSDTPSTSREHSSPQERSITPSSSRLAPDLSSEEKKQRRSSLGFRSSIVRAVQNASFDLIKGDTSFLQSLSTDDEVSNMPSPRSKHIEEEQLKISPRPPSSHKEAQEVSENPSSRELKLPRNLLRKVKPPKLDIRPQDESEKAMPSASSSSTVSFFSIHRRSRSAVEPSTKTLFTGPTSSEERGTKARRVEVVAAAKPVPDCPKPKLGGPRRVPIVPLSTERPATSNGDMSRSRGGLTRSASVRSESAVIDVKSAISRPSKLKPTSTVRHREKDQPTRPISATIGGSFASRLPAPTRRKMRFTPPAKDADS